MADHDFTGQALLGEFWYQCDVCGKVCPGSATTRDVLSLEQAGLRVCKVCLDQPSQDDYLPELGAALERAAERESEVAPP